MNFIKGRHLLITGALLAIHYSASAQLPVTYTPTTLRLNTGETLGGFIRSEETSKLNYRVPFKKALTDKDVTYYTPQEVVAVHSADAGIYEQIAFRPDGDTVMVTALGRLLTAGKARLYEVSYKKDIMYVVANNSNTYPLQKDHLSLNNTDDEVYNYLNYLGASVADGPPATVPIAAVSFSSSSFISYISAYNKLHGGATEMPATSIKNRPTYFLIAGMSGMVKNSYENELFANVTWRTYYPRISRTTALNIGASFFRYRHIESYNINTRQTFTTLLYTLPVTVQQFFTAGHFRPYVFAGFNLSVIHTADDFGNSYDEHGFDKNFGFGIVAGGGIEWNIYQGLMLKGEWRYENYRHLIMPGLAYDIPVK